MNRFLPWSHSTGPTGDTMLVGSLEIFAFRRSSSCGFWKLLVGTDREKASNSDMTNSRIFRFQDGNKRPSEESWERAEPNNSCFWQRTREAQLARQNIHPVLADEKLEKEEEMDSIQKNEFSLLKLKWTTTDHYLLVHVHDEQSIGE